MTTITHRPFSDTFDYSAMQALLSEIYIRSGPAFYASPGDLDWWRTTMDDPEAITWARLWLDGNRLVGFVWPHDAQIDMVLHPDYAHLTDELLAWAEMNRRATAAADEERPLRFTVWSLTGDSTRNAALHRRGYTRAEAFYHVRARSLDEPIPPRVLPPGYTIRHVSGEADIGPRVAVHRDAFNPSRLTVSKYYRATSALGYRPNLDLVAVAPDGEFASFALVWFDPRARMGVFEPVGTHRRHQRRGLAKAVMIEGLKRLQALGAQTAHVVSAHDGEASIALYESLGFREVGRDYAWTRRL